MSGTWMREADREKIWDLHSQGFNTNEIAPMVGRASWRRLLRRLVEFGQQSQRAGPPFAHRTGGDLERNHIQGVLRHHRRKDRALDLDGVT